MSSFSNSSVILLQKLIRSYPYSLRSLMVQRYPSEYPIFNSMKECDDENDDDDNGNDDESGSCDKGVGSGGGG